MLTDSLPANTKVSPSTPGAVAAVVADALAPTDHRSHCPWKGEASYFDVVVDGEHNPNAAFTYVTPKDAAAEIKDRVAFWHGVTVTDS